MKFNLRSLAAAAVLLSGSISAATAAPVLAAGNVFSIGGADPVTVRALGLDFAPAGPAPGALVVVSSTNPAVGSFTGGMVQDFGQSNVPLVGTGLGALMGAISFNAAPSIIFVAQNALNGGAGFGPYSFTTAPGAPSAVGSITTRGYAFVDLDGDQVQDANETAYHYTFTLGATFAGQTQGAVLSAINSPNGSATGSWSGAVIIGDLFVPEPASLALMGLALTGLAGLSRRRKPQA